VRLKTAIFFGLICAVVPVFVSEGYQIIEMNLPAIVSNAEIGFRGVCEKREVRTIYPVSAPTGVIVTHYVFAIKEMLKGKAENPFEVDQYGVSRAEAIKMGAPYAVGFTQFEPGKEYVVYWSEMSRLGVRTPLGMDQGVFDIVYDNKGRTMVVNKFSNANLFKQISKGSPVTKTLKSVNIDVSNPPKGPISYDDFKTIVENLK